MEIEHTQSLSTIDSLRSFKHGSQARISRWGGTMFKGLKCMPAVPHKQGATPLSQSNTAEEDSVSWLLIVGYFRMSSTTCFVAAVQYHSNSCFRSRLS